MNYTVENSKKLNEKNLDNNTSSIFLEKSEKLNRSKITELHQNSKNEYNSNKIFLMDSKLDIDENDLNNTKNGLINSKTLCKDTGNNLVIGSLKNKSINCININESKCTSEKINYNYDANTSLSSNKLLTKIQPISNKCNHNFYTSQQEISNEQNKVILNTDIIIPKKKNSVGNSGFEIKSNTNSIAKSKNLKIKPEKQEKFTDTLLKTPELKKVNTNANKNSNIDITKTNTIGKFTDKKASLIGHLMNQHSKEFKTSSKNLKYEKSNTEYFSNSKTDIAKFYSSNNKQSFNVINLEDKENSSKIKTKLTSTNYKNIVKKNIEINLDKRNSNSNFEKNSNLVKQNYTSNTNSVGSLNKKNSVINKLPTQKTFELNLALDSSDSKILKNNQKSNADNYNLNDSNCSLNNSCNVINEIIKIKKATYEDPTYILDKSNSHKNVVFLSNLDTNNSSPNTFKPKNLNKNFLVPTVKTNLYNDNEYSGNESSSNSLSENNSIERNLIKRNSDRSESLKRRLSDARDKKLLQKQNSGKIEPLKVLSSSNFEKINDELNEIRNNLIVKVAMKNSSDCLNKEKFKLDTFASNDESKEKCVLSPK